MNEIQRIPETMTTNDLRIMPDSFPLPDRADTFARPLSDVDQIALAQRREFANRQAEAANGVLAAIQDRETPPSEDDWGAIYESLTLWRSRLDAGRLGQGIVQGKDRITTLITDGSPNRDRIGDPGRLRAGAAWSSDAQAWVGGEPTPASRAVAEAGKRAIARFEVEDNHGDELQNIIQLSDGSVLNGNRIVRGGLARRIALELRNGVAARGHDVSRFETGGDLLFTVTADEADRITIFNAVMQVLANERPGQCSEQTWANIAYLLYQSPKYKKGSDAVIRTFLVVSGTYLLGYVPKLSQDIDLRAYTSTQSDFVDYMTQRQSR
jgi:hypothetical protein